MKICFKCKKLITGKYVGLDIQGLLRYAHEYCARKYQEEQKENVPVTLQKMSSWMGRKDHVEMRVVWGKRICPCREDVPGKDDWCWSKIYYTNGIRWWMNYNRTKQANRIARRTFRKYHGFYPEHYDPDRHGRYVHGFDAIIGTYRKTRVLCSNPSCCGNPRRVRGMVSRTIQEQRAPKVEDWNL